MDECSVSVRSESGLSCETQGDVLHKVLKTDTIAGLAIKYNTTISEIKAVNGLRSDFAMFARENLTIPCSRRGLCAGSPFKWTHSYQALHDYDSSPMSLWSYDSDELSEQHRLMRYKSRSTELGDVELVLTKRMH